MSIGKVIRHYRKERKLTQKKLGGLYHSDSHVSDIERGIVFPSHKTLIDFSNTMGVNLTKYLEFVDAEDPIQVEAVIAEAIQLVKNYQYTAANDLIKAHKENDAYYHSPNGKLIVAKYESIYFSREKKQYKRAIDTLKYALIKDSDVELGYNEIDVMNNIGTIHTMNGSFNDAYKAFIKAYEALEKLTIIEDKRLNSSILYNLSRVNIDLEHYDKVKVYSDELINYCVENEYSYMLAKAYYNRGVAEFFLDNEKDAVHSFKLAYYMFLGLNQVENAKRTLDYIKEHFNISF